MIFKKDQFTKKKKTERKAEISLVLLALTHAQPPPWNNSSYTVVDLQGLIIITKVHRYSVPKHNLDLQCNKAFFWRRRQMTAKKKTGSSIQFSGRKLGSCLRYNPLSGVNLGLFYWHAFFTVLMLRWHQEVLQLPPDAEFAQGQGGSE